MPRLMARLLLVALATLPLAGCSASPGGGPLVWIDAPLPGSTLPLGPVEVVSHANHPEGVGQVELSVDGALVAADAGAGQALAVTHQLWQPGGPGSYTLQVRAESTAGTWGDYARVQLTVGGAEPAASPTAAEPASPTASPTAVPSATPTASPTEAPTPTALPSATPTLPPGATPSPQPSATPTTAPTSTPPPTAAPTATTAPSGPAIGQPDLSTDCFYWGDAGCGPMQASIAVQVTDPAGVASVQLYFRLVEKATGTASAWSQQPMALGRAGWYRTLQSTDVPGYNRFVDAWFQFYFVAMDRERRSTTSPTYEGLLTLRRCIIVR